MKICSICNQLLDESCFSKRKDTKDGLRNQCKVCRNKPSVDYAKEYRQRPEVVEHYKEYYKEYNQRQEVKERVKEYRKDYSSKYYKEYNQRPDVKEKRREYNKEYFQTPQHKIRNRAGSKARYKSRQLAFKALGYSYREVVSILLQKAGLTKLTKEWHVDHIIPFSFFDHSLSIERCMCWHITNLKLIPAKENLQKSDKLEDGYEKELFHLMYKVLRNK